MSYLEKVDRYLDSLKAVPVLMKNRPPLRINKLIAYYNASQVLMASMICAKVYKLNLFRDGILYAGCRYPSNTQNPLLLDLGWWYFFAKFTELLDTVFFVLRKKNNQVTFLHVYHHVVMALYSWSYLKFAAGGEGTILALLNSIVHVVMYTYYLLSGLGPRFQKYLWWKKYVTKLQLIQFVLMLLYCAWTHFSPRCQYAAGFTYFICTNVIIFLILFLNFYSKSYKEKRDAEKRTKVEYNKTCNGLKKNGFIKSDEIKNKRANKEQNGLNKSDDKNTIEAEDYITPYEVTNACGDYQKNGKVYLTRRTAKEAFGPEFDLIKQ
ncbi:hypothetical protein ACJJTC_015282 [Scirpophaga incertulas]